MPPRKRTESAPPPEPELPETPTEETTHEPEAPKHRRRAATEPCTVCFPDGWPQDSTAVGCEHGSWARD